LHFWESLEIVTSLDSHSNPVSRSKEKLATSCVTARGLSVNDDVRFYGVRFGGFWSVSLNMRVVWDWKSTQIRWA